MSNALQIFQAGTTVTTGAASAAIAVPTASNGVTVKYLRVAATTESYVKLGNSGVVATTNDVMVQPADSVVLATNGATHIAHIQGGSSGKVNITPVENQ